MEAHQDAQAAIEALQRRRLQNRNAQRNRRKRQAELQQQQPKELEKQMKGSPQSEKDSHCGLSDGYYHESQTPYLNNTPNETGKYDFEGNIPVPARFESEISQSEVVDYARYATIQSEKPPKEKESPETASSIPTLNSTNIFDAMMEEMPTFVLDPMPGICSLSAQSKAFNNLQRDEEEAYEETLQPSRQFQQQKLTLNQNSLPTMALSTERTTRTSASTTRSPTPQLGTPESVRSAYIAQNQGKTALHISVERGNVRIVRFLLLYGIDVSRRDDSGQTALHYAARGPSVEIVAELLATGADLEARDKEGRTPLHAAADAECEPVIRLLVAEGAHLNATIGIGRGSSIEEGEYMSDYQQTISGE
ncbi:unnamed protein product [Penicillium discolor]